MLPCTMYAVVSQHRARGDDGTLILKDKHSLSSSRLKRAVSANSGAEGGNQSSIWNEAIIRLLHFGMIARLQSFIPTFGRSRATTAKTT